MPPSFPSIRTQINNYDDQNAHADIAATLKLPIDEEPQPSRYEALARLREELPVKALYHPLVLIGSTTVYRIIRDYLPKFGIQYIPPAQNRISIGLA